VRALQRIAVVSLALALAIVVLGGLSGRRVVRDDARCWKEVMLAGPIATPPACVPIDDVTERPAAGWELRVLAGFLALCSLLAAIGRARIATTLILTLGLAGTVITFVVTRAFESPFRETTWLWPYYGVRVCTVLLALSLATMLVVYVRRVMKVSV
jgi:hypothetical protein